MSNSEACRRLGIAYVPEAIRPQKPPRPRLIGPQGWMFIGLCAAAIASGTVLALVTP